ncbi:3118_t:CDS:1, partial [Gigaspora rosea]
KNTSNIVYLLSYITVMDESIFYEEYSQKTQKKEVVYINVGLLDIKAPTFIIENR